MSMRQGVAVGMVVREVLGLPQEGTVKLDWKEISEDDKKLICSGLVDLFMANEVDLNPKYQGNRDYIEKYVRGLANNWVRKGKDLNGNTEYVAKRPGLHKGRGDDKLRNLKAARDLVKDDPEKVKLFDEAIAAREEELKPKPTPVNVDLLPEHLKALLKK